MLIFHVCTYRCRKKRTHKGSTETPRIIMFHDWKRYLDSSKRFTDADEENDGRQNFLERCTLGFNDISKCVQIDKRFNA